MPGTGNLMPKTLGFLGKKLGVISKADRKQHCQKRPF